MKKLLFSLLFFTAIAWLWIGHMIAADGTLINSSGTTVTGGGAAPVGAIVTNGFTPIMTFAGNVLVSGAHVIQTSGSTGLFSSSSTVGLNSFEAGGSGTFYLSLGAYDNDTWGMGFSTAQSGGTLQSVLLVGTNKTVVATNSTAASKYGTFIGNAYMIGQINTTAGTANNWTSNNIYCGRVRISSGSQSYFITNTAVTTSSIVLAAVNTADATAFSCQAIPASGLLTLKLNGVAAGDCDISWRIVSP